MPEDDEDPPASVDNDTAAEPTEAPAAEPTSVPSDEEITEPKAPSAKDLIAGARKKRNKKGSNKKG